MGYCASQHGRTYQGILDRAARIVAFQIEHSHGCDAVASICATTEGFVIAYLGLLVGLAFAALGGELFVRGTVGIARAARISPGIIAATFAAFATSSPELTVGITAALEGVPQISLGDVLGSNIVNVALVLGIAMVIIPLHGAEGNVSRDFPFAILAPVILALMLVDGRLSRVDAAILLATFAVWLTFILREALRQRAASAGEQVDGAKPLRASLEGVIGLALLIAAGKLIVFGATGVAQDFGLSAFVIGATVVAIGTSVPELATVVIACLRGHNDVGIGTVLGSNIFNVTMILGVAAMITPIDINFWSIAPVLILGVVTLAAAYPIGYQSLGRGRGAMLLVLYTIYVGTTLQFG